MTDDKTLVNALKPWMLERQKALTWLNHHKPTVLPERQLPERELSFGEKAVGLTSSDSAVNKVKAAFARVIDLIHGLRR